MACLEGPPSTLSKVYVANIGIFICDCQGCKPGRLMNDYSTRVALQLLMEFKNQGEEREMKLKGEAATGRAGRYNAAQAPI